MHIPFPHVMRYLCVSVVLGENFCQIFAALELNDLSFPMSSGAVSSYAYT